MAYDNTAVRAMIRFLVRDPNADAINDTDLHNNYVLPAWQDWWFRFERRPRQNMPGTVPLTLGAGERSVAFSSTQIPFIELVEAVALIGYDDGFGNTIAFSPSVSHDLTRTDFSRIRYLQESEGAVGEPRIWGAQISDGPIVTAWVYPLPDAGNNPPTTAGYTVQIFGRGIAALTSGATVAMATDPVSARYVTRIAAFNLARSMGLPEKKRRAILAGLPGWVRVHFDFDRFMHAPGVPEPDVPLWRKQWPQA